MPPAKGRFAIKREVVLVEKFIERLDFESDFRGVKSSSKIFFQSFFKKVCEVKKVFLYLHPLSETMTRVARSVSFNKASVEPSLTRQRFIFFKIYKLGY